MKHKYTAPDVSTRKITYRFGDGTGKVITRKEGLYNSNLTLGELSLLRLLMWEFSDLFKNTRDVDIWDVIKLIRSWMMNNNPPRELEIPADILNDLTVGTEIIEFEE